MDQLVDEDGWEDVMEQSGIRIFVKAFPESGFKAYRSETIINTSIASIVSMALDVEAFSEWVQDTTTVYTVKKESENSKIYYMAIKAPWPIEDRDWVNRVEVKHQPGPKKVIITYTAVPNLLEDKLDHVRVTSHLAIWVLEPDGKQKTRSTWMGFSDPGGTLPALFVNWTISSSVLQTTENIKRQAVKPKYAVHL